MPKDVEALLGSITVNFSVLTQLRPPSQGRSDLWEAEDSRGQRLVAKRHRSSESLRRETHAYRRAVYSLGADRAPRLVASSDTAQTTVLTKLAGRTVPDQRHRLDSSVEWEVFHQAGTLLAQLHAAPHDGDRARVLPAEPWDALTDGLLNLINVYVPAHLATALRALLADQPSLPDPVVVHGDYTPRHWLWDSRQRFLRIIGFGRSGIESPLRRELPRLLHGTLRGRPDLKSAFFDGYGRSLTSDEHHACAVFAAIDAARNLRWGHQHSHLDTVEEALAILEHIHTGTAAGTNT
ncbi:aminoglycoside phosphotransferase family protein [Streptomyces sp. NPDC050485]|uniref:aminoglycoside phosphotransferase family protein n=1 Tax=Streptomyces sp. NPDC050485 TaxID=3365617 RepID=UPI0037B40CF8